MTTKLSLQSSVSASALAAAVLALWLAGAAAPAHAQQAATGPQAAAVTIDADDIGGVVSGASGPEAGVWVIAETTDLPTRYTKSVVAGQARVRPAR